MLLRCATPHGTATCSVLGAAWSSRALQLQCELATHSRPAQLQHVTQTMCSTSGSLCRSMPERSGTARHERGHGSFAQHLQHGAQNLQQGLSVPLSLLPQQLTALPGHLVPDFLQEGTVGLGHMLSGMCSTAEKESDVRHSTSAAGHNGPGALAQWCAPECIYFMKRADRASRRGSSTRSLPQPAAQQHDVNVLAGSHDTIILHASCFGGPERSDCASMVDRWLGAAGNFRKVGEILKSASGRSEPGSFTSVSSPAGRSPAHACSVVRCFEVWESYLPRAGVLHNAAFSSPAAVGHLCCCAAAALLAPVCSLITLQSPAMTPSA